MMRDWSACTAVVNKIKFCSWLRYSTHVNTAVANAVIMATNCVCFSKERTAAATVCSKIYRCVVGKKSAGKRSQHPHMQRV